ncbi:MAG: type II secretion system protein [Deltaproteobacteria bacterium]|nr:type II secretion system protein [Deltaproteobacteria bacterium]
MFKRRIDIREDEGFTYLGALFLVVIAGVALAVTGSAWSTVDKREKEEELLFVGTAYVQAIKSYYETGPGERRFPRDIAELENDRRFPVLKRHIRRLYKDPLGKNDDLDIIKEPDGSIVGVRSKSSETPFKQDNFPKDFEDMAGKTSYSDWEFRYRIRAALPGGAPGGVKTSGALAKGK